MRFYLSIILIILLSGFLYGKTALLVSENTIYSPSDRIVEDILKAAFCNDYDIKTASFSEISDFDNLKGHDLLLVPNGAILPAESMEPIHDFLKSGGDILVINSPMWDDLTIFSDGKYIKKSEYDKKLLNRTPDNVVFDFKDNDGWHRNAGPQDAGASHQIIKNGGYGAGKNSLNVKIEKFNMWDVYGIDINPYKNGATVFEIVARGSKNTDKLAVECSELDGSRWIATIALSDDWKRYYLKPEDFNLYTIPGGVKRESKYLVPDKVVHISVGLALTHMSVPLTSHEYEISEIGTSRMSDDIFASLMAASPIALDSLSKSYNIFECSDVAGLTVNQECKIIESKIIPMAEKIYSVQPRPQGHGFNKGRDWRFINLIEAYSPKGEWRGVPASMKIHSGGEYKNSVFVSFPISDINWYKQDSIKLLLKDVSKSLSKEVFFIDAGTQFYTYFKNQKVIAGARIVNLGGEEKNVTLLLNAAGEKRTYKKEYKIKLKPYEIKVISDFLVNQKDFFGGKVNWQIIEKHDIIDNITQDINCWQPKEKKEFVTVKNGNFYIGDKLFRPYGTNYIASSAAGTSEVFAIHHPFSNISYDPEITDRDIKKILDLGFNSVSLFIFKEHAKDQNLLDMLSKLEKAGLKANLALRPGTPMDNVWTSAKEIIGYYNLRDNDTVWAYDLAWEPVYGNYFARKIWDREWETWIIRQYGSVDAAEANWGYSVPRDSQGKVTSPNESLLNFNEGAHSKMSVAYRRFLDVLLYKKYNEARCLVKSIDPNHQVSFRMCETSNPFYINEGGQAYDFNYLGAGVDFLGPEGYGRIGEWERVKPGWFIRAYGKWAAGELPLIWPEAGVSVWNIQNQTVSKDMDIMAAGYYRNFLEMLMLSESDGVYFWYMCPGLRVDERSDYGIINSDFTDREITKVIREYADKFINSKSFVKPIKEIEIKTDTYSSGIAGIYTDIEKDFWKAVEDGYQVSLYTEATGKDIDNVPLISIDNRYYSGKAPLKYIDGGFEYIELISGRQKNRIADESVINTDFNSDLSVNAKVCNLNEALWLKDRVSLILEDRTTGYKYTSNISQDVKRHDTCDIKVNIPDLLTGKHDFTLGFAVDDRIFFGEKIIFTVNILK